LFQNIFSSTSLNNQHQIEQSSSNIILGGVYLILIHYHF